MFFTGHRYQRVATAIVALFLFCGEVQGVHDDLLYVGYFLARGFPLLREISEYLCIEGFDEVGSKEGKGNYDQQGNKGCKD
jgi:hypothetical protein